MKDGLKIVAGPTSVDLSKRVAELLHSEIVDVESRTFPDGESCIRLTAPVEGERVAIVQTFSRPQDRSIIQLLQIISAARDLGATKAVAVVPYFAYARQDKRFRGGEVVTSALIAKLIEGAGADAFLTVDAHSADSMTGFTIPAVSIDATSVFSDKLREMKLRGASVVAPDEGGLERAGSLASLLDGETFFAKKSRDRATGKIVVTGSRLDVSGKNVVIFDDIISTGGTVVECIKLLARQSPARIIVACVHALLVGDALRKILTAGAEEIIATDTLPTTVKTVSVASLIAEGLSRSV